MHSTRIEFDRSTWVQCMIQLKLKTEGGHESGCFVLGTNKGNVRVATKCVYYDELDPKAYSSGVCILDGDAFTKLWEVCRSENLSVVADLHTHPHEAFQSESDRTNPMIARQGHLAIIVPNFASGWIWRHRLGLYRYEGDHRWTNLSGWQARRYLNVNWSLI